MYLRFNVESQHLTRTDRSIVVARSENYLKAKFDFSPDWDGVTKTGVFMNGGRVYNVILDNDECFVPTEVIRKGCFTVSVFGGDLITADVVTIRVEPSGYEIGGSPEPPTPEVYEQVLGMFDKFRGGEEGQVLSKSSDEDLEFEWVNQGGGGGGTASRWGNITGTLSNQADLQAALDAKENAADAFDGNYENLTNKPALFSGDYRDLTNKPELFSGNYEDLTNKPEVPTITANPTLSGTEAQLEGLEIDGIKYAVPSGGGSGTTVVANPTLVGTEPELDGIEIGGDKLSVFNKLSKFGENRLYPPYTTINGSCTVTENADGSIELVCETAQNCGLIREYPITMFGNHGITVHVNVSRNSGDEGSKLIYGLWFMKQGGSYHPVDYTLNVGYNNIHQTFYMDATTIAEKANNGVLRVALNSNTIRNVHEDVFITLDANEDTSRGTDLIDLKGDVEKLKIGKDLYGRKVIFLGDSITAFTGNNSWVDRFCEITGVIKIVNTAVSGAKLADQEGTVYDGDPKYSDGTNNVLGNQVQKIINNHYDTPDIIIIAIGTNDGITCDETRLEESYIQNGEVVPLANVDRTYSEGAFRYANETLHNLYPNAIICWCSPIHRALNSNRHYYDVYTWSQNLEKLTAYGSAHFIDTMRCGILMSNEIYQEPGEYLEDGTHPNSKGAIRMASFNADAITSAVKRSSVYVEE